MKAVIADVIMGGRGRADPSLAAQSTEQLVQFTRLILIVIVHAPRDMLVRRSRRELACCRTALWSRTDLSALLDSATFTSGLETRLGGDGKRI